MSRITEHCACLGRGGDQKVSEGRDSLRHINYNKHSRRAVHCPCDVKSVRKTQFSGGVIWNGSLTAPLPCLFKTASGMKGASFDGLSGNTFHPSASLSSYPQFLQAHFFRFFCSVTEGIGFLQREHVYTFDFHSKEAANQLGFL